MTWNNLIRAFLSAFLWVAYATADEPVAPATLSLNGHELFLFRSRLGSISPADRVRLISKRIDRLSEDPLFDLSTIMARNAEEAGWEIVAADQLLLVITPNDAKLAGYSAKFIAEGIAFRLREILAEDRRLKSPKELTVRTIYALGYILLLVMVLWGIRRLYRRVEASLDTVEKTGFRSFDIRMLEVLPAERIVGFLRGVLKALRFLLTVALLYFSIPLILSLFPWTANLSPLLLGYVIDPLNKIWSAAIDFIPNLFFITINILVVRYLLKGTRLLFDQIEKGNLRFRGFYPEWAHPTYQLVRVFAIALAAVIVFPYIPGSNSPAFQGVSVFLGVLVSLGSTSAVANVVAGIVITYMRSFKPGDRVKIADTTGDIVEKTLLVTRVRTVKNVDITIPNSLVLSSHIVNYSSLALSEGLILHTEVTIGYDAPWRRVHELLIRAAKRTDGILDEPEPFVFQTALNDSYVCYQLNAYTRNANSMTTLYSGLHQNIQDSFNEAGIEIMSPAYSAIRDGNTTTIPADKRPLNYSAPSFRVNQVGQENKFEASGQAGQSNRTLVEGS